MQFATKNGPHINLDVSHDDKTISKAWRVVTWIQNSVDVY
jgi:hypothetical protein